MMENGACDGKCLAWVHTILLSLCCRAVKLVESNAQEAVLGLTLSQLLIQSCYFRFWSIPLLRVMSSGQFLL
jgi:hypothetical protein